jgi:hypothetical protein
MQSTGARVAVAIASLAAIVVLFIVFSGGSEDADPTATDVATTTATEEPANGQAEEPPPEPARPEIPVIRVVGGEPSGGPAELEFRKGERVRFAVVSDVEEEIHVHGYDIYAELVAGERETISFLAEIDGVFEIELHGTGAPLADLRVRP